MVEPLNTKAWVLIKRGAYWRPDAQGYTYFKDEAGRYSDEEAASYVEHDGSNGTTSKIRWDAAPELSPGCTDEAARRFYASRVQSLEAENERLREHAQLGSLVVGGFKEGLDRTAARVQSLEEALRQIRELNMLAEDENGHRWANSDMINQTIVLALSQGEKP